MSTAIGNQTITMLPAGQGESYLLLGTELVTIKVSAAQTGGAFMTAEATIPPGSGPPLHRHQPQELFYILEGEFAFPTLRDGRPHVVQATIGAVVHIPSWVPHTYKNVGATPGRLLATFTPPTLEGYFRDLGDPVADPSAPPRPAGPPDWERIAALHRTYHIEYLQPAP